MSYRTLPQWIVSLAHRNAMVIAIASLLLALNTGGSGARAASGAALASIAADHGSLYQQETKSAEEEVADAQEFSDAGQYEEAIQAYQRAAQRFEEQGQVAQAAAAWAETTTLLVELSRIEDAILNVVKAAQLYVAIEKTDLAQEHLFTAAYLAYQLEIPEDALQYLRQIANLGPLTDTAITSDFLTLLEAIVAYLSELPMDSETRSTVEARAVAAHLYTELDELSQAQDLILEAASAAYFYGDPWSVIDYLNYAPTLGVMPVGSLQYLRYLYYRGLALIQIGSMAEALTVELEVLSVAAAMERRDVEIPTISRLVSYICSEESPELDCYGAFETIRDHLVTHQRRLSQGDDTSAAWQVQILLADVYNRLGQYAEADALYASASELDPNYPPSATTLEYVASDAISIRNSYADALPPSQELLALWRSRGLLDKVRSTLTNLGIIYLNLGQYDQALNSLQEAAELAQVEELPHRTYLLYDIYHKTSFVYWNTGRSEKALEFALLSLSYAEALQQPASVAAVLNTVASLYYIEDNLVEARKAWEEALVIQEREERVSEIASTLSSMASSYRDEGDLATAEEFYLRALEYARLDGDPFIEAGILQALAGIAYERGNYDEALAAYQEVLTRTMEFGNPELQNVALIGIAQVYKAQGDFQRAIDYLKEAIALTESIRSQLRSADFRGSYFAGKTDTYDALIDLLWNQGQIDEAFYYAERARSRAFLDQLALGPVDYWRGVPEELRLRGEQLINEAAILEAQLKEAGNVSPAFQDQAYKNHVDDLEKNQKRVQEEYDELLIEVRRVSTATESLLSVDAVTLTTIQNAIEADTTLVEYHLTEDQLLAFVITSARVITVSFPISRTRLRDQIEALRTQNNTRDDGAITALQTLYGWLIAPLQQHLRTPLVVIVPYDALYYLPFAALTDGQKALIDHDFALYQLPSATMSTYLNQTAGVEDAPVLVLGDPKSSLQPLNAAGPEVEYIAGLFGTTAFSNTAATEDIFWSYASQSDIIHLAAHGEYNSLNPNYTSIYLTDGSGADTHEDGLLQIHELYELDLTQHTRLVVLSACQVDLNSFGDGAEMVAMSRAFLYAGTDAVISTMWKVDDRPSTLLIMRFYDGLLEGKSKAVALREAQKAIRKEYPHPYFWAGFVLTGVPDGL